MAVRNTQPNGKEMLRTPTRKHNVLAGFPVKNQSGEVTERKQKNNPSAFRGRASLSFDYKAVIQLIFGHRLQRVDSRKP